MAINKITYNVSLNKQESTSQVKQQLSDKLTQENSSHTNKRKQRHLKGDQ